MSNMCVEFDGDTAECICEREVVALMCLHRTVTDWYVERQAESAVMPAEAAEWFRDAVLPLRPRSQRDAA